MHNLLDSMFPPHLDKNGACLKANSILSQAEQDLLLQIIADFEVQGKDYDYNSALDSIAQIMMKCNNKPQTVDKNGVTTKIPIHPKARPFLIKQVLFYMAVACKAYKLCNQNDIVEKLRARGVSISNNFFSCKMSITPTSYKDKATYTVPTLSVHYNGQKKEELACAIRNLVAQAGKYNTFVDAFGGSGEASVAFPRKKDAVQVYNELNRVVYNLFEVIADDKMYLELISSLKALQDDLANNKLWLDSVDFDEEIEKYYNNKNRRDNEKRTISEGVQLYKEWESIYSQKEVIETMDAVLSKYDKTVEFTNDSEIQKIRDSFQKRLQNITIEDKELEIIIDNPEDTEISYEQIKSFMNNLYEQFMLSYKDASEIKIGDKTYSKDELIVKYFSNESGYYNYWSFIQNYDEIMLLALNVNFASGLVGTSYSSLKEKKDTVSVFDKLKAYQQHRYFKYYAYFSNLRSREGIIANEDKVLYAVAEIFVRFLTTQNDVCDSAVLYMVESYNHQERTEWRSFLNTDFEHEIIARHQRIKGIICENESFESVITKYAGKKGIFYADPPYISTVDYDDEVNGVAKFTAKSMKMLIDSLKNTGNYFIFSHRACKSKEKKEKIKSVRKENAKIKSAVFDVFKQEFEENSLYVLAFEKFIKNDEAKEKNQDEEYILQDLASMIADNKVTEIMITNYKIHDFSDAEYPKVKFKVYTYEEFLDILDKNMNL